MKKLKITQLIGILLLLLGVVIRAGAGEYYGTGLAVLGLLIYAAAKVSAWIKNDKAT
jgi:drug/metabolite transporter (DMT)-like permease